MLCPKLCIYFVLQYLVKKLSGHVRAVALGMNAMAVYYWRDNSLSISDIYD
eukprot:XP_001705141.1 Hypothetical protein GL50803_114820 [Giardia lamblia ATCC 50803]